MKIKLNMVTDVADFVELCSKCIGDVFVHSGRFIVSGKSILGMYSLDLTKPIEVEFNNIPIEVAEGIKKYIVN